MSRLAIPPPIDLSPQRRRQRWGEKNKIKNKTKQKNSRKSSHQQVKQIQAAVFSARSVHSSPFLSLSLSLFLSPSARRLQRFCFTRMRFFPLSLQLLLNKTPVPLLSSPLSSTARPPSPLLLAVAEPRLWREERENHTQSEGEREGEREGREEWSYLHPEIPLLPRSGGTNQCVMVV